MYYSTQINIHIELIRGLLCTALEGGSNYWYTNVEPASYPENKSLKDYMDNGSMQGSKYWHWSQLIPTTGGSVKITTVDNEEYILDDSSIKTGIHLLSSKYSRTHFMDFISENDDADTGDVFLQLCLFKELVYA